MLVSMNGQVKTLDFGDMAPNPSKLHAWENACRDLRSAVSTWRAINSRDLPVFNAMLVKNDLKVLAPAPGLADPVCAPVPTGPPSRRGVKAP